jgi:1,4-dihydroxy-2-naphthoyl-CoA hydrolase
MTQPTMPTADHLENASAFVTASGLKLREVSGTRVTGWIDLTSDHHQPFGLVHGGVYCSVIESAASIGATTAVWDDGMVAVGVNNNTNFVASITEGRVEVVAEPVVQGRTQQLWNVRVTRAEDDRLIATGQVRLQNVNPR